MRLGKGVGKLGDVMGDALRDLLGPTAAQRVTGKADGEIRGPVVFVIDLARGFRLVFQGVTFLARHRALWKWALLPTLVNMVVSVAAFALLVLFVWTTV